MCPIYPQNHILSIVCPLEGVPKIVFEPSNLWGPKSQHSLDVVILYSHELFRQRNWDLLHWESLSIFTNNCAQHDHVQSAHVSNAAGNNRNHYNEYISRSIKAESRISAKEIWWINPHQEPKCCIIPIVVACTKAMPVIPSLNAIQLPSTKSMYNYAVPENFVKVPSLVVTCIGWLVMMGFGFLNGI